MKLRNSILLLSLFAAFGFAQVRNKAAFIQPKSEYWEVIQQNVDEFNKKETPAKKSFKMDFTGLDIPKSKSEFTFQWHNDPINQGITGTCWSFSTTSYFESEIYRLTKKKIKLSEMHTAYWEYVEKARGYVQSRGTSNFGEGSEANAIQRVWPKYGVVTEDAYNGMLPGQKSHDHSKMFAEMENYLKAMKANNAWDENAVISTIKSILNQYMGAPPASFVYENKTYTPLEFFRDVTKINFDDYIDVMSLMEKPYYEMVEYEVPDNWWHSKEYYNVPLDLFMSALKSAVHKGFTVCIGGDVSEPGIDSHAKVAMVPTFDIPSDYIDEYARQMRFTNGTTGDDHGIHLVGYFTKGNKDWFLIKDSGSGAYNVGDKGYYFYSEDFVKLKMLGYLVHKDAVPELLKKP
jgi:bleomycin hydrolase